MDKFSQFVQDGVQKYFAAASDWQAGYLSGVLVTILLFIITFLIVHFLFRSRKYAKNVVLSAPNGEIFISARSIADLVKSLDSDFAGIIINKVYLLKNRKQLYLELHLDYQRTPSAGNAQLMVEELQAKTLATLESVFGIQSITRVQVTIGRTRRIKSSF